MSTEHSNDSSPSSPPNANGVPGGCRHEFPRPVAWCPFCGAEQHRKQTQRDAEAIAEISAPIAETPPAVAQHGPNQPSGGHRLYEDAKAESDPQQSQGSIDKSTTETADRPNSHRSLTPVVAVCALLVGAAIWAFIPRTSGPSAVPRTLEPKAATQSYNALQPTTANITAAPAANPETNASSGYPQPNFCAQAAYPDESAICASSGLSYLELRMEEAFKSLRARQPDARIPPAARSYARTMLQKRHECGEDANCIDTILLAEKSWFDSYGE